MGIFRQTRGFTIIELIVVISIIGILTVIAVLNVTNSSVIARDAEREEDARAIARHFEELYDESEYLGETYASYPGTVNASFDANTFTGTDPGMIRAPGVNDSDPNSFTGASNTIQTPTGVLPQPSKSNDKYVYQPLKADGTICEWTNADPTLGCVKFNLFYYNEKTNSVKRIMSKYR